MFDTKIIRSTLNGRVGNEQVVYMLQFVGFQKVEKMDYVLYFYCYNFHFD